MLLEVLFSTIFSIVQLNTENLFDCHDNPLTQDEEFLPDSYHHWTHYRYWRKLNHIGQEIIACGTDSSYFKLPDLVALEEVENDSVLADLTKKSLLRKARYEYVISNSSDIRGINVALLYSPFTFKLLNSHDVRVCLKPTQIPTRNILYASGLTVTGDTLHVMVVHAPSRANELSERIAVSQQIVAIADSIKAVSFNPKILIAGDFNAYHHEKSLQLLSNNGLINASAHATGKYGCAKATYRYQGQWGSLDHIWLNESLAKDLVDCFIYDKDFLLIKDEKYGGYQPRRTYIGPKYQDGFSDHLPLVARFEWHYH